MKLDEIRSLYKSDPTARAFFDHAATRQRNRSETTVERTIQNLDDNGSNVSRGDVVDLFKRLQELECGKFIPGRHNHRSRFAWEEELTDVARAATGESDQPEAMDEPSDWLLSHTFHLREDFEARLELPYDLTREEADRLALFVRALPFETE